MSWPHGKNTQCEFRLIKLTQISYHVAFRFVLCYNAEMFILIDQLEAVEDPRISNAVTARKLDFYDNPFSVNLEQISETRISRAYDTTQMRLP